MKGKVCLVTGATGGIGKVTALELARQGATVVIIGRHPLRTEGVTEMIKRETGNPNVSYILADLSKQAEVRRAAAEFLSQHNQLHILVNNAGAFYTSRQESADGIELTMALNHLAYFLLTDLLLDTLKASAPARIINVSSDAHRMGSMDFNDLEGKRKWGGWRMYGRSKLANILFTKELARRLAGTDVTVNCLHPGVVATGFAANNGLLGTVFRKLLDLGSISAEKGAETTLYLATSPEVEHVTGLYFDKKKPRESSPISNDQAAAEKLWQWSEQKVQPTSNQQAA
ncbi:SDR family oxidoreductase [Herpetosiphon llansteffanensis]|uniref:SDR family oxidoreductase n=1 Tax=Herpetosiphon llansteffanensis TaxID=2094568 RepID=UPI000D7C6D69|nr:SDR family oxidoreductase [Herpetosiphon llansteffanensis]